MAKNKKSLKFLDIYKSLRKTWNINPETKIIPNKKKKSRYQLKLDLKKELHDR